MGLSTNAKVGIVVLIAIISFGGIVLWKGDIFLKVRGYELIGSFQNVGGLQEGADVRYRGFKVGKVLRVIPGTKDTRVFLNIASHIEVPEGSTLRIAFDGLIGQKYVEIMPIDTDQVYKPGSVLRGYSTLGLVDFIDVGTINLEELKKILESVRKVTDDPATQKAIKEALINIEGVTFQLNKFIKDLNEIMAGKDFKRTLQGLSETSEIIVKLGGRLERIADAVDKLTSDPEFSKNLLGAAKSAKEAMEEVKNAAIEVKKTVKKLAR